MTDDIRRRPTSVPITPPPPANTAMGDALLKAQAEAEALAAESEKNKTAKAEKKERAPRTFISVPPFFMEKLRDEFFGGDVNAMAKHLGYSKTGVGNPLRDGAANITMENHAEAVYKLMLAEQKSVAESNVVVTATMPQSVFKILRTWLEAAGAEFVVIGGQQ